MGVVRYRVVVPLLAGLLAAALVAAAFAPRAAAVGRLAALSPTPPNPTVPTDSTDTPTPTPTPTPAVTPTPTPPPPPELVGTTEVVGWGVVILFAWVMYPIAGLLLYIAALAFVAGDKSITAQVAAIVLILFAPIYTLIRAGLGGRRK
jgi:hypothetical protein